MTDSDPMRLRTVISYFPDSTRALRTCGPRFPVAWSVRDTYHDMQERKSAYTGDGDSFYGDHIENRSKMDCNWDIILLDAYSRICDVLNFLMDGEGEAWTFICHIYDLNTMECWRFVWIEIHHNGKVCMQRHNWNAVDYWKWWHPTIPPGCSWRLKRFACLLIKALHYVSQVRSRALDLFRS